MNINLTYIVAVRHPYWLPPLNTGLPPEVFPGDWLLSSWSGRCSQYAVKLDLEKWSEDKGATIWLRHVYPPMGLIPRYALEVLVEYDRDLLKVRPWIEVIGYGD